MNSSIEMCRDSSSIELNCWLTALNSSRTATGSMSCALQRYRVNSVTNGSGTTAAKVLYALQG